MLCEVLWLYGAVECSGVVGVGEGESVAPDLYHHVVPLLAEFLDLLFRSILCCHRRGLLVRRV